MCWGKLEIKERPIIPEGIVSKKLSTVATAEFPGLMPNTEIDLFDNRQTIKKPATASLRVEAILLQTKLVCHVVWRKNLERRVPTRNWQG
jgi:hypothetical protein